VGLLKDFTDLHSHSTYSLLDAFGTPKQIVLRAQSLQRKALAITDHGSISGWIQFGKACSEAEIKPIFGYEAYAVDSLAEMFLNKQRKKNHITLLAESDEGYRNLLKVATLAYDNFYYFPTIDWNLLCENSEGIIVLSGCWSSKLQRLLANGEQEEAEKWAVMMKDVFKDRFFLETQHYDLHMQTFDKLKVLSERTAIPIVLTCDPHYQTPDQAYIQEILHAIRDKRTFEAEKIIEKAFQWESQQLFDYVSEKFDYDWDRVFSTTAEIAERCSAKMQTGSFPSFISDSNLSGRDLLLSECKKGIERYGLKGKGKRYNDRFKRELEVIEEKGYVDYILIAADLIRWAKENGTLVGSGRGSSAGSLICYLLGITSLDPIEHDLLFERFIDVTRTDPPDIDTDFDALRRDLVKEYAKQKYGADKVCDIATFAKFKGKNSLDEIGKVYKIPRNKIEIVKRYLIERSGGDMRVELTIQDTFDIAPEAKEVAEEYPAVLDACVLEGQLRHLAVHAAGVLISTRPLDEVIALYKRDDRVISSFEMRDASSLGLIKVDFLGLDELSIQREIFEMAGREMLDIYKIPLDDLETLQAFKNVDVQGIFQYVGDSTKSVLRQLPYVDFEQLIACLTLSKPGPAHSGSATRYIAKMRGSGNVGSFDWHPILAEITSKTFGQIIYQEQIIRILREFANFSVTDANTCRVLIAKSKGEQEFHRYYPIFEREVKDKISTEQAKHLWDSIKVFGRYAFNRSHAASYAMVGYWSMYMKTHYADEFYVCKLNHEAKKEEKLRLLMDAAKKGYEILPPLLGVSGATWAIEGEKKLRAALTEIDGIGEKTAVKMIEEGYSCREDFQNKKVKGVTVRALKALETAQGFQGDIPKEDFFGIHKYDILDILAPERVKSEDIRDWDKSYFIVTAGRFVEMNYKDIFEERASRGQSTEGIKNPDKAKYAMLLLEDETDRCLVHVDRYLFDRIGSDVWKAYNEQMFVVVSGVKVDGWRMVRAREIALYANHQEES